MRIALVGAGAIGTILGARMSKAGEDIVLADTYADHVKALNSKGATLSGHLNETIPVKAASPDQLEGTYDLLIMLTKQTALRESLQSLRKHTHEGTLVLTLQNGIPEDIAREFFALDKVWGGGVEFSATFAGPGCSELTCDPSNLAITIGRLDGTVPPEAEQLKRCFAGLADCHITDNLLGMRYTKLTDNSVFSGLPTALGCEVGDVLDSPEAMAVIAHLGREAGMIIEKLGIHPIELFGLQPLMSNVGFTDEAGMQKVIKDYWTPIYTPYRKQVASMLQDIRKGNRCEILFIDGKFVEKAKELGMQVPFLEKVVDVVSRLENKELSLDKAWDNLKEFTALLPKKAS